MMRILCCLQERLQRKRRARKGRFSTDQHPSMEMSLETHDDSSSCTTHDPQPPDIKLEHMSDQEDALVDSIQSPEIPNRPEDGLFVPHIKQEQGMEKGSQCYCGTPSTEVDMGLICIKCQRHVHLGKCQCVTFKEIGVLICGLLMQDKRTNSVGICVVKKHCTYIF